MFIITCNRLARICRGDMRNINQVLLLIIGSGPSSTAVSVPVFCSISSGLESKHILTNEIRAIQPACTTLTSHMLQHLLQTKNKQTDQVTYRAQAAAKIHFLFFKLISIFPWHRWGSSLPCLRKLDPPPCHAKFRTL